MPRDRFGDNHVTAMAFRVQFSRVLRLSFRARPALLRPQVVVPAARWSCIASSSSPAWNSGSFAKRTAHPSASKSLVSVGATRRGFASAGITLQELEDRALNVLKLFDKVQPDKVTLEAHFMNDLGLDSLDVVEIVMAYEDEFGVEISDEEAEKIFTCKDGIELLKTKMDIH